MRFQFRTIVFAALLYAIWTRFSTERRTPDLRPIHADNSHNNRPLSSFITPNLRYAYPTVDWYGNRQSPSYCVNNTCCADRSGTLRGEWRPALERSKYQFDETVTGPANAWVAGPSILEARPLKGKVTTDDADGQAFDVVADYADTLNKRRGWLNSKVGVGAGQSSVVVLKCNAPKSQCDLWYLKLDSKRIMYMRPIVPMDTDIVPAGAKKRTIQSSSRNFWADFEQISIGWRPATEASGIVGDSGDSITYDGKSYIKISSTKESSGNNLFKGDWKCDPNANDPSLCPDVFDGEGAWNAGRYSMALTSGAAKVCAQENACDWIVSESPMNDWGVSAGDLMNNAASQPCAGPPDAYVSAGKGSHVGDGTWGVRHYANLNGKNSGNQSPTAEASTFFVFPASLWASPSMLYHSNALSKLMAGSQGIIDPASDEL